MKKKNTLVFVFIVSIILFNSGCITNEPIETETNMKPSVSIIATPLNGTAPLTVSFKAIAFDADGSIEKYQWDFDDNTTSIMKNPVHTFDKAKTYNITLTVTDNEGETNNTTSIITVVNSLYWINLINKCFRHMEVQIVIENEGITGEKKVDLSSCLLRKSSQMVFLDQNNLPTGGDVQVDITSYIGRFPFKKQHSSITVSSKGYSGIIFTFEGDKIIVQHVNYVPLK